MILPQIDVSGSLGLIDWLGGLSVKILQEAVTQTAYEAQAQIIANAQGRILRVRTGRLISGWGTRPRIEKNWRGARATLSTSVVYAAIHEFGSDGDGRVPGLPGGVIRPIRGNYLKFQPEPGRWVSVREVRMPARRYVTLALEYVIARLPTITQRVIRTVVS